MLTWGNWACWAITAWVSLTTSEIQKYHKWATKSTPTWFGFVWACFRQCVCAHPHMRFSSQQPFIRRRGWRGRWWMSPSAKGGKRNRDPIQLFHSIEWSLQYIPLCWEGQSSTSTYSTLPKEKKKTSTKEKEGRGLFSFRALPDMTATMKRVWL